MEMTSFVPENFFGREGWGQIGAHTQKREFFRITRLELRALKCIKLVV